MDQHEYVRAVIAYYDENYYEPGNSEDGIWQDCHYPKPKCLGGVNTIKLLKQHHAVQGVLQSEEYQCPCIWGWELKYLQSEEHVQLYNKWIREKALPSVRLLHQETCYLNIAFEQLQTPAYWGNNPSAPKPVLIHYRDGEQVYTESIKQAARITGVNQSTIQHRLRLSVYQQFNRSWAIGLY